jgi:hypothetical protein
MSCEVFPQTDAVRFQLGDVPLCHRQQGINIRLATWAVGAAATPSATTYSRLARPMAQGSNAAQPQPPSRRESHSRDSQHQNRARDPRLARVRLQPPTQAPNGAQPQAWAQRDSSRDNRRRGGYSPSPLPRRESQPRHRDRSDESGAQPQALARRDSSRDNRQRGGYSPSPLPWRESQPRHRDRNDEPSEDHFLVPEATVGPLMGTGACNVVALSKQTVRGANSPLHEKGGG